MEKQNLKIVILEKYKLKIFTERKKTHGLKPVKIYYHLNKVLDDREPMLVAQPDVNGQVATFLVFKFLSQ